MLSSRCEATSQSQTCHDSSGSSLHSRRSANHVCLGHRPAPRRRGQVCHSMVLAAPQGRLGQWACYAIQGFLALLGIRNSLEHAFISRIQGASRRASRRLAQAEWATGRGRLPRANMQQGRKVRPQRLSNGPILRGAQARWLGRLTQQAVSWRNPQKSRPPSFPLVCCTANQTTNKLTQAAKLRGNVGAIFLDAPRCLHSATSKISAPAFAGTTRKQTMSIYGTQPASTRQGAAAKPSLHSSKSRASASAPGTKIPRWC